MRTFGSYLVERDLLTRAQLSEATQSQVVFGGRLGTNLVELGYLQIEDLERLLSEFLGVPAAPPHWLEDVEREVLDSIPLELVQKHRVLPLRIEDRTLHLAVLDPNDPAPVDDAGFATGLGVRPYVVAELRLTALLEHYFELQRDTRYITLGPEHALGRHGRDPEAADSGSEPSDAETPELIDEETFTSLHSDWQTRRDDSAGLGRVRSGDAGAQTAEGGPVASPASAAHAVRLETALREAPDRATVARLALEIARLHADAAALFVVRGGVVSGFRGDGDGAAECIDGVLIPVECDSAISRPARTGRPFRGTPTEGGIDHRILTALGRSQAREILVHPIEIRSHVVNLLYVDNGSSGLGETSAAALAALCTLVAEAYGRLILDKKRELGEGAGAE